MPNLVAEEVADETSKQPEEQLAVAVAAEVASTETASTETYGMLSIGGVEVALPIATLREVVPCPSSFQLLGASADGLLGAMELRGAIVPAVDIRSLMGAPINEDPKVLVVMTNGEHVIGLLADELRGVQNINNDDLIALGVHDGSLLFSNSFLAGNTDKKIVSILDIEAVLRLPGMPLVADVFNRVNQQQDLLLNRSSVRGTGAKKYTLVNAGSYTLGFDIDDVHTTIPMLEIRDSILRSNLCRGVIEYDGFDVPVLDTLALFGLGSLSDSTIGAGLVAKFETGYVVLALSSLMELREINFSDMSTLPDYAHARSQSFLGMTELETGICLIIDGTALRADDELVSHAAINTEANANSSVEASEIHAVRGDAQLTFSIGFELAVPLGQIDEILPVPAIAPAHNVEPFVLGVIAHRDAVIPALCLSTLLGREPIEVTSRSCLLLVTANEFQVALAVDSLVAIDALSWTDPESDVRPIADRAEIGDALSRSPLIQVSESTKLLPQVDLKNWVSLLVNPTLEQLSAI